MLRHDDVTGYDELIAEAGKFECVFKEIARGCCIEIAETVITTEGEEVEVTRVFETGESAGHGGSLV